MSELIQALIVENIYCKLTRKPHNLSKKKSNKEIENRFFIYVTSVFRDVMYVFKYDSSIHSSSSPTIKRYTFSFYYFSSSSSYDLFSCCCCFCFLLFTVVSFNCLPLSFPCLPPPPPPTKFFLTRTHLFTQSFFCYSLNEADFEAQFLLNTYPHSPDM